MEPLHAKIVLQGSIPLRLGIVCVLTAWLEVILQLVLHSAHYVQLENTLKITVVFTVVLALTLLLMVPHLAIFAQAVFIPLL